MSTVVEEEMLGIAVGPAYIMLTFEESVTPERDDLFLRKETVATRIDKIHLRMTIRGMGRHRGSQPVSIILQRSPLQLLLASPSRVTLSSNIAMMPTVYLKTF